MRLFFLDDDPTPRSAVDTISAIVYRFQSLAYLSDRERDEHALGVEIPDSEHPTRVALQRYSNELCEGVEGADGFPVRIIVRERSQTGD